MKLEDLSARAYNCLTAAGITNLADLSKLDFEIVIRFRHMGYLTVAELIVLLEANGFRDSRLVKSVITSKWSPGSSLQLRNTQAALEPKRRAYYRLHRRFSSSEIPVPDLSGEWAI